MSIDAIYFVVFVRVIRLGICQKKQIEMVGSREKCFSNHDNEEYLQCKNLSPSGDLHHPHNSVKFNSVATAKPVSPPQFSNVS